MSTSKDLALGSNFLVKKGVLLFKDWIYVLDYQPCLAILQLYHNSSLAFLSLANDEVSLAQFVVVKITLVCKMLHHPLQCMCLDNPCPLAMPIPWFPCQLHLNRGHLSLLTSTSISPVPTQPYKSSLTSLQRCLI